MNFQIAFARNGTSVSRCPNNFSRTKGRLGPFNLRRISGGEIRRETTGSKLNRKYGFNERRRVGKGSRGKKMTDVRTSKSIVFKQRRASLILDGVTRLDKYERRTLSSSLNPTWLLSPANTRCKYSVLKQDFFLLLVQKIFQ